MIWAPDASWACFITSMDEYFPVPTMSREENSLPPRTRFVSFMLPPAHRSHDFHFVSCADARRRVGALGRHLAVPGDRRVLALHAQLYQQRLHAGALRDLVRLAVHRDLHRKQNGRDPHRVRPRSSPTRRVPFAGIIQSRFEGSRAAPGSQESSPHDANRSIPSGTATSVRTPFGKLVTTRGTLSASSASYVART